MGSLARTPSPSPDRDRARRDALMNRDRNTPLRPAPPPPKMNIVNAATAIAGAQSTQQSKQRRGNVIINKRQYRRLDAIGKGGSSKVYKVMAENFKVFAMKKVTFSNEEDGQAAILGYKGEIELLKKLEKVDRVIRLFDYEINDERGCLLMLMECGETDLAKLIQMHYAAEGAILDISFTRHYWREMLLCVQAVHELNIIHSDLKPANFLVVQGRLKLIDFGIANAIVGDTVNVHRESQVGTVNYMSPEALTDVNASPTGRAVQSVGGNKLMKLGAPSDVWSLGCILYQMVYGRPPFANLQTIFQKLAAIPNPRHEIQYPETGIGGASVPLSVIGTMQDCLERDKNDRATIAQLLSDDNAFLNPDKRKEGTVEITEDALKRLLENVVEHTTKGDMLDKNAIKAWAHSIYGKLEVQQRKRPPRMRP
ncbi:kinase-like domain-containing protein [Kalaharituber pfeilii]|nr:kinase-like domain-containing protein [Kalaharituber pfeilii]